MEMWNISIIPQNLSFSPVGGAGVRETTLPQGEQREA
jgi:hypothetical protein